MLCRDSNNQSFSRELTVNSRSVNKQMIKLRCLLFFFVIKKAASYFVSIKRGVTILNNYKILLQFLTVILSIFINVKKKNNGQCSDLF